MILLGNIKIYVHNLMAQLLKEKIANPLATGPLS